MWNERFTSSVGYSMVDIDNSVGQTADAYERGQYALVNLLYHPVENLMWGGELQWGERQNKTDGAIIDVDGVDKLVESFDDFRVQVSVKYSFSYGLGGK